MRTTAKRRDFATNSNLGEHKEHHKIPLTKTNFPPPPARKGAKILFLLANQIFEVELPYASGVRLTDQTYDLPLQGNQMD